MQVTKKIIAGVAVLKFTGSLLGEPDATKVRQKVHSLVDHGVRKVVIEMGDLKWINSAGLGSLIAGLTTLRNAGGDLRLAKVPENVESLFRITQLVKVFKTYGTIERAVTSFQ